MKAPLKSNIKPKLRPDRKISVMQTYNYKFVDSTENVQGSVDASNVCDAAIKVLKECGGMEQPRWKRHGILERAFQSIPDDNELVEISRLNVYLLDIRKNGSRKRKPMRIVA